MNFARKNLKNNKRLAEKAKAGIQLANKKEEIKKIGIFFYCFICSIGVAYLIYRQVFMPFQSWFSFFGNVFMLATPLFCEFMAHFYKRHQQRQEKKRGLQFSNQIRKIRKIRKYGLLAKERKENV